MSELAQFVGWLNGLEKGEAQGRFWGYAEAHDYDIDGLWHLWGKLGRRPTVGWKVAVLWEKCKPRRGYEDFPGYAEWLEREG